MDQDINRRGFLRTSLATSTGAALGFVPAYAGIEERVLLAQANVPSEPASPELPAGSMPLGKIKDVKISRLICGGNLISGFAHSRDLIYVSELLRHYFTDDKVMDTLELAERNGVNTAILRLDDHTLRILDRYWRERGGEMQWIAQIKPKEKDLTSDADQAVEKGAIGVYIQGEVGDRFTAEGNVDLLGKALEHIKECGVIAGMGAHTLDVVKACVKEGIEPDFYMKTLNAKNYWSAGPKERHDSVWAETPEETIEFMKEVDKPWIAFKVLGAGAIRPKEGFQYAFEHGADFICVGMFDFQVREDARIARDTLSTLLDRERPWRG